MTDTFAPVQVATCFDGVAYKIHQTNEGGILLWQDSVIVVGEPLTDYTAARARAQRLSDARWGALPVRPLAAWEVAVRDLQAELANAEMTRPPPRLLWVTYP